MNLWANDIRRRAVSSISLRPAHALTTWLTLDLTYSKNPLLSVSQPPQSSVSPYS